MHTLVCPHCHVASHFTPKWSEPQYDDPRDQVESYTAFAWICDRCKMPVCGVYPEGAEEGDETVWPIVGGRIDYRDVPDAIAGAAREAHQALAALAPRASIVMARAAIESMANDKGITDGNLVSKIAKLHAQGFITQDMKDVAEEIRLTGNEAAHGDILNEPISVTDAQEIVELTDAMLMRVYQEPGKVAHVRASRLARQNKSQ